MKMMKGKNVRRSAVKAAEDMAEAEAAEDDQFYGGQPASFLPPPLMSLAPKQEFS